MMLEASSRLCVFRQARHEGGSALSAGREATLLGCFAVGRVARRAIRKASLRSALLALGEMSMSQTPSTTQTDP